MMHRVLPPPLSAVRRSPTVCPASSSSEPKYILAPASWYWSMPWLNATVGIPAATAFWTTGTTASALDSVTAMPDTWLSMAFCTSVACSGPFSLFEYCRVIPWALAASWAPARILSQNVSPACSWVIIWNVRLLPEVPPPAAGAALPPWLAAPPWLLHAASANEATATKASTRSVLRDRSIFIDLSSPSRPRTRP